MDQEAVNQATDAVTCVATTSMSWPEVFVTVGVAFVVTFIIYYVSK